MDIFIQNVLVKMFENIIPMWKREQTCMKGVCHTMNFAPCTRN